MNYISDVNDIRVAEFHQMKKLTVEGFYINQCIADGDKVVSKAVNSNLNILKILAKKEFIEQNYNILQGKIADKNIFYSDKEISSQIVGFQLHTGVMALIEIPKETDINTFGNNIVVTNNIEKAENIGSIIRSGVGFGFHSYMFDSRSCHPFNRKSVRVSMGAAFNIDYHICNDLIECLEQLRNIGYRIIALELDEQSIPLNKYQFPEKSALVFGSEARGIEKNVLDYVDSIIEIPISHNIDSLNVNISSAIVFNHIYNSV